MSRLTCLTCGADLGDAEDPYRDPDCLACLYRSIQEDLDAEVAAADRHAVASLTDPRD